MKFRKGMVRLLVLLLAALPVLGVFAAPSQAATSRVAIIKSLKGTVQVKKSGGSKEFKAFARMSLNEGDVLTTSGDSSAVLQFANGTSEDDRMSVSANTTLTFSKLSDRNGTRTKVSMFSGNAWVDVKSITTKNDEFTLETPTAIMGVRGTHLMVIVDPLTGSTRLTVAAGVVNTQPTGSGDALNVTPGDQALVTKDETDNGEVYIAPVDLNALMQNSAPEIVEAVLNASSEIAKENSEKMDQYLNNPNMSGTLTPEQEEQLRNNIDNLLGALIQTATDSGKVTPEKVKEIVSEAESRTGFKVDLSKKKITLSEEEKRKQAEMQRLAVLQRQKATQQKLLEEQNRKQLEDLMKKIEEEKKKKEEELNKALEERRQKALDNYQKGLSDAEQKRFNDAKKAREQEQKETTARPSPSASQPDSTSNEDNIEAHLSSFVMKFENSEETVAVNMVEGKYLYQLPNTDSSHAPIVAIPIAAEGSQVKQFSLNNTTVSGITQTDHTLAYPLSLISGDNVIKVVVQEGTNPNRVRTYTFNLKILALLKEVTVQTPVQTTLLPIGDSLDLTTDYEATTVTFKPVLSDAGGTMVVKVGTQTINPDGSGYYSVNLADANPKQVVIEVTDKSGDSQSYHMQVIREPKLSNLELNNSSFPPEMNDWSDEEYHLMVDGSIAYVQLKPSVEDTDHLSIRIDGELVASGSNSGDIHLYAEDERPIEIAIMDKASDFVLRHYTIYITRGAVASDESIDRIALTTLDGDDIPITPDEPFSIPYEVQEALLYVDTVHMGTGISVYLDGVQPEPDLNGGFYPLALTETVHNLEVYADGVLVGEYVIDRSELDEQRNAKLSELSASFFMGEGSYDLLSYQFDSNRTSYTSTFYEDNFFDTEQLEIQATPFEQGSTIIVQNNGTSVEADGDVYYVPLQDGENSITVTVTALDGLTKQTYRILATRLPIPDKPVLLTDWMTTIGDTAALVNWYTDISFEFNTRLDPSITELSMKLAFDDSIYRVEAFDCSESCGEPIGEWTHSNDSVSLALNGDFTTIEIHIYEIDNPEHAEVDTLYVDQEDQPEFSIYNLYASDETEYGFAPYGTHTFLASIPYSKEKAYVSFNTNEMMNSYYSLEDVTVDDLSAQWKDNWGAYEIPLMSGITEVKYKVVDLLGRDAPTTYSLKIYTDDTSGLSLDPNNTSVSVTNDVYNAITFNGQSMQYETSIYYTDGFNTSMNLPPETPGNIVKLYDFLGSPLDINSVPIGQYGWPYDSYYVLVLSEDQAKWQVIPLVVYKSLG